MKTYEVAGTLSERLQALGRSKATVCAVEISQPSKGDFPANRAGRPTPIARRALQLGLAAASLKLDECIDRTEAGFSSIIEASEQTRSSVALLRIDGATARLYNKQYQ